jgi:hypothetical protein
MDREYTQPIYPLTKIEYFDEDIIKVLLKDTNFSKEDRNHLTEYNKKRLSGGTVNVSYKFGSGCEEHQLGRLFPSDGIGLQSFRFDIRNPLAQKYYFDIDVNNAHYRIANGYCLQYGLKNDKIKHYINNREEVLKLVSDSRKKSKTEFLKILYGGEIKLYHNQFKEVEGTITDVGYKYLKELKKEVEVLMNHVWMNNEKYHKLKTGKEKKSIDNKPNPKASLMSILFQTEERKILMFIDWFMSKQGRYMSVFIHDGGYVKKLEGETIFPEELLIKCSEAVSNYFGYPIKLEQKEIISDYKPVVNTHSQYEIMKKEFELKTA